MLRLILRCTIGSALLACSGEGALPQDEPPTREARSEREIDFEGYDFRHLIYWEDLFIDGAGGRPPSQLEEVIAEMAASPDGNFEPFLIDLAFHGTPYAHQALSLLLGHPAPFSSSEVLSLIEQRGFKRPDDDLPAFLTFKQALFATIFLEFSGFFDPSLPRTISAQEVVWGGVAVDGIPPLHEPNFVTPQNAERWILPDDEVIGVLINGDARAYPRRIIDWHELVNDTVGGVPVALAYCTLCGSAILYDARAGDRVIRFGTSGLLYRSNKLMYDYQTRSLWEQFTGQPVWGPLVGSGIKLTVLPVVYTTWAEWFATNPTTKVLDIATGFARDYRPGVAYADYWASPDLRFPAPDSAGPLERRDWVYVVRSGDSLVVYPLELLRRRDFLQDRFGPDNVVVIATIDGSGARAYLRGDVDFQTVQLEAGTLRSAVISDWRLSEEALIADDGQRLARLPGHRAFWFAITNHAAAGWRLYTE